MILIKDLIDVTELPELNYPRIPYPTSVEQWTEEPYRSLVNNFMKDCGEDNRKGGRIALIPPNNQINQELETYFRQLDYDVVYFNNDDEMQEYMLEDDYTRILPDGTRKQICLGVTFSEFENEKYEYSLRYNVSGPTKDHWDIASEEYRIRFKVDDLEYTKDLLENGTLTLQFLIEGMILSREVNNVSMNVGIRKMKTPAYSQAAFLEAIEAPLIILFIIAGIVAYLRFVALIVEEREKRIIDNMESMGMKKIDYILANISFFVTVHLVMGLVLSGILSVGVLKNTNFFIIFFIYLIFVYTLMLIGLIISAFFTNTKKAIIASLIVFFILYMFWILRDNVRDSGQGATIAIALSPVGNLSQVITNLLIYENSNLNFSFTDLSVKVYNYTGATYFIMGIVQMIIFSLLGIYFFYVIPLDVGVPRHPLFFLGYSYQKTEDISTTGNSKSESQIIRENEDYEPVELEFAGQTEENKTILIDNLVKKYSNDKLAVNHLSTELYSNQIFALLGHNGAGKTTTISIISGFINKTSGNIKIFGFDSVNDKEEIKKFIGVCPQVNPIFNFMTVEEHLRFYSKLKGFTHNIDEEMDIILKDIDLYHKKKQQAKHLSGGQKRKLCVAIAFIGGSKIILLDEPTSGMDTYARRFLWEMIKKYKEERLIILTTHNMDEADYLGDRIGIMSEGKMVTCGSSLFLKNRFGVGYDLTIVKNLGSDADTSKRIKETIQLYVPSSNMLSDVGSEMKFRLPQEDSAKFPDLFYYLENNKDELNIDNYGTGITTLEEVFLNVAADKDDDLHNDTINNREQLSHVDNNGEAHTKTHLTSNDIDNKDLAGLRLEKESKIFFMQMKALMKKRFIYFSRDIGGLICEIFLPIVIIIIGLSLSKIQFVKDSPKVAITPDIYDNSFLINSYTQRNTPNDILNYFVPDDFNATHLNVNNANELNDEIFQARNDDQTFAYYINNYNDNSFGYTAFFNITAPFSPYISVNQLNNAFLRYYTGNPNAYIKMNLHPLGSTSGIRNLEATIDGFITVLLFALAFAFIPASLIVYIIKEREFNAKHQQLISGVNIYAYWLTNFIIDYVKYLIPALVAFALLFIFRVDFYTDGLKSLMSLLLLLFFGYAMIAFVYVLSFAFRTPSSGQITIFIISFFAAFVLVILIFSLKLIESTRDIARNYLEWIFRLFPFFSFPNGFFNMANDRLYKIAYLWEDDPGPFSSRISLWDLIFLILVGTLLFIAVIVIENSFLIYSFFTKKKINKIKSHHNDIDEEGLMSDDVKEEEQRVKSEAHEYSVKVEDLVKKYKTSTGTLCWKKTKQNLAVKGITFGVEPGTVFGLLGTNGAGKSSTFKILTGDTYPTSGSAYIMQKKMPENLTKIRHLVGYCPQFDTIIQNLTAQEHLELYASLKGIKPEYHKYLIDQAIETLNLEKFRNKQAGTYSGGNKRKLSVAIAMIGKPPIIFLDEPSSGMDPRARRFMWGVINEISTMKKYSTIILTTHSMEEAEALATKLAIMVEGHIKTIGSVQQLKNKYGECFEVEMKIKLPTRDEMNDLLSSTKSAMDNLNINYLDRNGISQILRDLQKAELIDEISDNGKGKYINQQLSQIGAVKLPIFAEWIHLTQKFNLIEDNLKEKFDAKTLEIFQSFARFKIESHVKLYEIFGYLESNKENLKIATYSVKQISLEQIFIEFAKLNQHEE